MALRLLPVLLALVGIAFFVRLGFWQLDRAQEKQALFDGFEQSLTVPPELLERYFPQPRFARVAVRGQFLGPDILLDNQPLDGRQGAFLLTPFRLSPQQALLVNRGWLAMPRDRSLLPPLPPPPAGIVELTGHLSSWPRPGIRLGQIDYSLAPPWRVPYLEPEALSRELNLDLAPQMLLATGESGSGLAQNWRPQVMAPERHRGYALQWFSLAAAVLLVTVVLQWRRYKK